MWQWQANSPLLSIAFKANFAWKVRHSPEAAVFSRSFKGRALTATSTEPYNGGCFKALDASRDHLYFHLFQDLKTCQHMDQALYQPAIQSSCTVWRLQSATSPLIANSIAKAFDLKYHRSGIHGISWTICAAELRFSRTSKQLAPERRPLPETLSPPKASKDIMVQGATQLHGLSCSLWAFVLWVLKNTIWTVVLCKTIVKGGTVSWLKLFP